MFDFYALPDNGLMWNLLLIIIHVIFTLTPHLRFAHYEFYTISRFVRTRSEKIEPRRLTMLLFVENGVIACKMTVQFLWRANFAVVFVMGVLFTLMLAVLGAISLLTGELALFTDAVLARLDIVYVIALFIALTMQHAYIAQLKAVTAMKEHVSAERYNGGYERMWD